jgi:hypothetical protein
VSPSPGLWRIARSCSGGRKEAVRLVESMCARLRVRGRDERAAFQRFAVDSEEGPYRWISAHTPRPSHHQGVSGSGECVFDRFEGSVGGEVAACGAECVAECAAFAEGFGEDVVELEEGERVGERRMGQLCCLLAA